MMNIAEFTILGRVGKIKPFDSKTNVTICANYSFRNREGERDSAAHWNEVLSAARIRAYSAAAGRERRKFSGCQSQLGCAGFRG